MTETTTEDYRQTLDKGLNAGRILAGLLDEVLGIQKALPAKVKLGIKSSQSSDGPSLEKVLCKRLEFSLKALGVHDVVDTAVSQLEAEVKTGQLALDLLVSIHTALLNKRKDPSARVAVEPNASGARSLKSTAYMEAKEDVGLGIKDIKLVCTLQSLASRWVLATRKVEYDQTLHQCLPAIFPLKQTASISSLNDSNRFTEIVEEEPEALLERRQRFIEARQQLSDVMEKWGRIVQHQPLDSEAASASSAFQASTDVSTIFLRTGIVDFLGCLLRLAFGPSFLQTQQVTAEKDEIQQAATKRVALLLKFLSTQSAISTLSAVMSGPSIGEKLATPNFVKAASSRLLSAQLLRPDGVRSLLIETLGSSEVDDSAEQNEGSDGKPKNTLQKFEQLARLLGTPPRGMPDDVYFPLVLPRLLEVISPDPATVITAPAPSHMRAAAFVLTRISEKNPLQFNHCLKSQVYAFLEPKTAIRKTDGSQIQVVTSAEVSRSITILSSILLFSEPSPAFYKQLFEPILPQLLSLQCFLNETGGRKRKIKIAPVQIHLDTIKKDVDGILRTWTRLVDAKEGSQTLINVIRKAENGIGSGESTQIIENVGEDGDHDDFFWEYDAQDGISIQYGRNTSRKSDVSSLLNEISLSDLAKMISNQSADAEIMPKLPAGLSASLHLQPDPRIVVSLLQKTGRKDIAKGLLPHVLNTYMALKTSQAAKMLGDRQSGDTAETRSVLYLQLILQLFETFGSDLLDGEVSTTLAFIDFSLSSPADRRKLINRINQVEEKQQNIEEEVPFITKTASPSVSSTFAKSSLFNITKEQTIKVDPENDPVEETGDEHFEDDEELVITALTLLLSLLEGHSSLSTENASLLVVIESKMESLVDSENDEIRSLAKEALMVLTARRNAIRGPMPNSSAFSSSQRPESNPLSEKALGYAKAHETYQEALKFLQDPILPVRAHGLVLLRKLVSDDKRNDGQRQHLDPALLPAIQDIFIQAIQDEESYLYLNAVQGLSALAASGDRATISSLVGIYLGRDDRLVSVQMTKREIEKRLRVGEALLQVIQRSADALAPHLPILVPPLLTKLRDPTLPTILRSSIISTLGTTAEAVPLALAISGLASEMATTCLDLLTVEMVQRPNQQREKVKMKIQGKQQMHLSDEEEEEPQLPKPDNPTSTDSKLAPLRRAALLLLVLLVRGAKHQLIDDQQSYEDDAIVTGGQLHALRLTPGGPPLLLPTMEANHPTSHRLYPNQLVFPINLVPRLKQVAGCLHSRDTDAVVRVQAKDCIDETDALQTQLVLFGWSSSV